MELLTISVVLEQAVCIRGESVYFKITLENSSKETIRNLPDFDVENESITLVLTKKKERLTGNQGSLDARDGVVGHGVEEPSRIDLAPGEKLQLRDDLLAWFGELAPGKYQVQAVYEGRLFEVPSKPVALTVEPAAPIRALVPRYSAQDPGSVLAAAWVHQEEDKVLLFYQQQSSAVPRNAIHGIRVAEVEEVSELYVSTASGPDVPHGHVLWLDDRDRLMLTTAHVDKPRVSGGVEVKPPFKGHPLASPRSTPEGGLLIPYADQKDEQVVVIEVSPDGTLHPHALDLGKAKPLGAYACYWEYDTRLHFVWTTPKGREIHAARWPLDDRRAGFVTRSVYASDDPVLWIDAYLDADAAFGEAPYFEEHVPPNRPAPNVPPPGPKLMLWCVTETSGGLQCTRVNVADSKGQAATMLDTGGAKELRVIGSVVTSEYALAILLADAKDRLYYASTIRGSLQPLSEVAGKPVSLDDGPGLIRAGRHGSYPWVYLRYMHDRESIDYIRLEPADQKDPVERHKGAKSGRGKGS